MKYVVDSFSFHLIRQFEPKYDTIDFFSVISNGPQNFGFLCCSCSMPVSFPRTFGRRYRLRVKGGRWRQFSSRDLNKISRICSWKGYYDQIWSLIVRYGCGTLVVSTSSQLVGRWFLFDWDDSNHIWQLTDNIQDSGFQAMELRSPLWWLPTWIQVFYWLK